MSQYHLLLLPLLTYGSGIDFDDEEFGFKDDEKSDTKVFTHNLLLICPLTLHSAIGREVLERQIHRKAQRWFIRNYGICITRMRSP